jgi:hypothetical protein
MDEMKTEEGKVQEKTKGSRMRPTPAAMGCLVLMFLIAAFIILNEVLKILSRRPGN